MIDTVRLRSPFIEEEIAHHLEDRLKRHLTTREGVILDEIVREELVASHDARVMVQVRREETVVPPGGKGTPMRVPSQPHLIVEASVHKLLLGHNIAGGPCAYVPTMRWFVNRLAELLEIPLPAADGWQVERIDWAECFHLLPPAIQEYIDGLNSATYPRRKAVRHDRESIYAEGEMTTVKLYHKGPEFKKHDAKRLRKAGRGEDARRLQARANEVLRLEVTIKARKLRADFKGRPLVRDITEEYLRGVFDREMGKFLKEGRSKMNRQTVRTHKAVMQRLREVYNQKLARTLYATWMQLAMMSEDEVRAGMPPATFYRNRTQLMEAGCAWSGTDIMECKSEIPEGFSPTRDDPRHLAEEDPAVTEQLLPFFTAT